MRAIVANLLWKEFRELRWETAMTAAVALVIPLFYAARDREAIVSAVDIAFVVYPLLAGTVFGMRAAASERSSRAAGFLWSLPVRPELLGAIKLAATSCAALVPLLLLAALGMAGERWTEGRSEIFDAQVTTFGVCTLATLIVLVVVATFGSGASSEVAAAIRGIFGGLLLWGASMPALLLVGWVAWLLLPLGQQTRWLEADVLVAAILVLAAAFAIAFVVRYARALGPIGERPNRWIEIRGWSPAGLQSPQSALAWKELREVTPLSLQVLAAAISLALFAGVFIAPRDVEVLTPTMQALNTVLWLGGFLLAMLLGASAVAADVQPATNTFWRSRPISPSTWYWTKYAIGIAAILLAVALPTLITLPFTQWRDVTERGLWWSLLLWTITFSLALTLTCLVRRPVTGGILAVGAIAVLYAVLQACFGSFSPWEPGAPLAVLAAAFVALGIVSTLAGWWIAVRDYSVAG